MMRTLDLTLTPIASSDTPPADILWQATAVIAAVIPFTLLALIFDDRQLNDINIWIKPLKFQVSVALHLATLAYLSRYIAPDWRQGRMVRIAVWACSLSAVFEIAYITSQAAKAEHSHFNFSTPFASIMYTAMGIGAVILIAVALLIGVLVWVRSAHGTGEGVRWGTLMGTVLGFGGTLIIGGVMSANSGHWVGGVESDANGLFLAGWAKGGGDLRVPHFFATHLMQALPLIGLAADTWSNSPIRWVIWCSLAGLGITAATFVQALAGIPFIA